MIDAAKKKPNMKEIASDLQTQQFRYWYYRDDMNTPDSVYTALHLGIKSRMAIDDLLGDTLFLTWINYVKFFDENTKKQQAGYLSKLKSWYDDEGITVLVNSAKSRPNTLEFASTLRREQIERWLSNGKSPVDVWKILKHGVIGDNVLASPEFRILFTYVNRFNNAYPNKKTTVVTALRDADHSGPLNAILGAIKSNKPGTEYIAKQMEAAFFKTLLRKYDPKQVFKMFQLHLSPEWFFERPLLPIWVKYTNVFNSKNPDKKTTMVTILRTQFGDATLYKMLVKGKKVRENVPKTKGVATKLLGEQVQHWVAIGKSPDDVFKLYKLKTVEGNLLDSPQFLKWLQYVDDLKAKHPEKATTAISSLTTQYGDDALLKLLETAEKVPSTKDVASKFLSQQTQHWAATGKSPDDVFMLYKMNTAADKVFENAQWKSWVNYVKLYNEKNPKSQTSVVASLSRLYGDAYLVNMLAAAGKVSTTKSTSKKMEFELINLWLKNDQSTDDVFKLLDLDKAADKVLGSPQLEVWGKYAGYINKKNPDNKASLIAALSTHYKDEGVVKMLEAAKKVPATEAVATRLQTEQLHHWLSIDRAPANIFTLFKLDKAGENLLLNPQFLIWRKYTDDFGLKNPMTTETTIGVLRMNYEDDVLANLIIYEVTEYEAYSYQATVGVVQKLDAY
ncbi:Avirulence (Avh) protein [Phytophthora megakarya]|uniref:Avirulence (Avh) protein n=1 Tax=Phytophthora megakarya TaxID=4795 RepID=A0A225WNI8_9STRA|nr:Avirulence (Avh) protein [Phytophthora megakarya]